MSDSLKIILTACLTLIGGCGLTLFSVAISKIIIEPYIEYRKALADITFKLIMHQAHIVSGLPAVEFVDRKKVPDEIRELSARLRAVIAGVPFVGLLRFLRLVPKRDRITDAAGRLIRISNLMLSDKKDYDTIYSDLKQVGVALHLDIVRD